MMRHFIVVLAVLALAACRTAPITTGNSPAVPLPGATAAEPKEAPPDSVVKFLLDSAASDFHAHRPPDPVRFRDVRIAHVTSPTGEKQYRLCGEFLPAPAPAQAHEGAKDEWISFVTIKTSGYEQYIGGQAADLCKGSAVTGDEDDLSSALQSRLDSLR